MNLFRKHKARKYEAEFNRLRELYDAAKRSHQKTDHIHKLMVGVMAKRLELEL